MRRNFLSEVLFKEDLTSSLVRSIWASEAFSRANPTTTTSMRAIRSPKIKNKRARM